MTVIADRSLFRRIGCRSLPPHQVRLLGLRSRMLLGRATFCGMPKKPTATGPASAPEDQSPRLNTALHLRLLLEGRVKPSTLASAKAALERIRSQRSR